MIVRRSIQLSRLCLISCYRFKAGFIFQLERTPSSTPSPEADRSRGRSVRSGFFYLLYPCIAWLVLFARRPSITAVFVFAWCAIWILFSCCLYNRAPHINAWGTAHFGPIADMQQHFQDSLFIRPLAALFLALSPQGEFVFGAVVAQLYVQLQGIKVTVRENSFGTGFFAAAAASVFLGRISGTAKTSARIFFTR